MRHLIFILAALLSAASAHAQIDWDAASTEATEWLQQYLRIDTTNPPGNETRAAGFFARILQEEGIPYHIMESSPGRGIIYARLKGDGSEKGLLLLNHLDVVQATRETWSVDPFGGVVKDGFLYGRGAGDMKTLGMLEFATFVQIARNKLPLERDLVFLGTADEEAGGYVGAGWFVEHHRNLLDSIGYLINEGGGGRIDREGRALFRIGVAEKTPCWVRLTAYGVPAHGSRPRPDSAVHRLLRALDKIMEKMVDGQTPPIVTPVVERYFRMLGEHETDPEKRARFQNLRESVKNPAFLEALREESAGLYALLHNTANINLIKDYSGKVNVVAPKAEAQIDFRLVPGYDGDEWIAEVERIIADPSIRVLKLVNWDATDSPVDSPLADTIREVMRESYPEASFVFSVSAAFNDSHWFRPLGITSYGFSALAPPVDEAGGGVHGNDERVSLAAFQRALPMFYEIVQRFCVRGEAHPSPQ